MAYKCLVHGCSNMSDQGHFIGELCAPCHGFLKTGVVKYTDSFLKAIPDMEKKLAEIKNKVDSWSQDPEDAMDIVDEIVRLLS